MRSPTSRVSSIGSRSELGEPVASPLGHAMVGMAAAAVASRVAGGGASVPLWIGAFIASGVPDLDLGLEFVGLKGPKYHRNASHSLFVLAALSGVVWVLAPRLIPLETAQRGLVRALGTPEEDKQVILFDMGHAAPSPRNLAIKEVLSWADRVLGPVG